MEESVPPMFSLGSPREKGADDTNCMICCDVSDWEFVCRSDRCGLGFGLGSKCKTVGFDWNTRVVACFVCLW